MKWADVGRGSKFEVRISNLEPRDVFTPTQNLRVAECTASAREGRPGTVAPSPNACIRLLWRPPPVAWAMAGEAKQSWPWKWGRLMELIQKVHNYIKRHRLIDPGDLVLAAVSGGPDSVAMLHILRRLAQEDGFTLHIAHLNHMFRGAEAARDADFVSSLAGEYGLPATIEAIDVPAYNAAAGLSAQAAAREVRYGFLQRAARQIGAGKIALAHHADDQAETILMNILHGAGTGGLRGITPVRGSIYVRPLLSVRRDEIEDYCLNAELPFRTDSSNAKPIYLRNRIRMELLPLLTREYNPGVVGALLRQAEICREEDSYLRARAESCYAVIKSVLPGGGIGLSLDGMKMTPPAILRRVIRLLWSELTGAERNLSFAHVERLIALPAKGVGAKAELPGGITAVLTYDSLGFRQRPVGAAALGAGRRQATGAGFYHYPIKTPGETFIPETHQVLRTTLLTAGEAPEPAALPPNEALLDLAMLPAHLYVRNRRPGDLFLPYGQKAPMKLKNFLINQKIPREERDAIPLLCAGEEIIWVAGVRAGEKWKVTGATNNALYLQLEALAHKEAGDKRTVRDY